MSSVCGVVVTHAQSAAGKCRGYDGGSATCWLETWRYFISLSQFWGPLSSNQTKTEFELDSKLTRMPLIYLWRTGAHIADRLSLIGVLLGTYDSLLHRVCPNLRTRVSLFVSTVRSTTERHDSRATFREPKQTFDRSRALSLLRTWHLKINLIIDQSTKFINLSFSDTSRNRWGDTVRCHCVRRQWDRSLPCGEWNPKCLCGDRTVVVSAPEAENLRRKIRTRATRAAGPRWAPTIATVWHISPTHTCRIWGTEEATSTRKLTRITVQCRSKGTRWMVAISNSGQRSIITRRNLRLECPTLGFHLMTDWAITNKWNRMVTGRIVHLRWRTIWVRSRTGMVRMGINHRRLRFTRRASYKRRRRRRAESLGVPRWSRRSKCRTICTHSSTWCSMECHLTNSTSCTLWMTCSIRRRCRLCTSSPCTRNSQLLNSPRQILMRRCLVHSILGCGVNLVSLHFLFTVKVKANTRLYN